MHIYTYICWIHADATIKTQEDFLEKYLPLTLLQGFEKGYSRFACERELETEHNWNILTPNLWPSTLCLSRSQMLNRRSRGWVIAFFTASYQHLLRTSTHQGPKAPSAWCGFPYHISTPTGCNSTVLCSTRRPYITFKLQRRDMDTPPRLRNFFQYLAIGMCHFRYLWNGLCDRHRAEITVMQFTGHSLPVRQSMSVPWEFFTSSHFISQFPPTRFPLITAIGMCHFLPVHHLEWHFWPGQKVKT